MNNQLAHNIVREVKKVVCGKDEIISKIMMAILAGGNILMDDIPGVGKTTMALAFAKSMGMSNARMQFTADVMPTDVIGFSMFNAKTQEFEQKTGPIMCNLFMADEINRTSSKTQSALLEAMEEKQVTIDGITMKLPEPFVVIATQNPVGSAGTQNLPDSQLDRFMICVSMGYPSIQNEIMLVTNRQDNNPIEQVIQVADADTILAMQKEVAAMFIDEAVIRYAVELCDATRRNEQIYLGVSPRGTLSLVNMAKAYAYVNGRTYVVPDDIQKVFFDVTKHRIILSSKARAAHASKEAILKEIVGRIMVPGVK